MSNARRATRGERTAIPAQPTPPASWIVLIYTVPAEPSRLRAHIWRELKKVGAEYLRDGVCILPQRQDTAHVFSQLAAKVHEFGGSATLIRHARIGDKRTAEVAAQMQAGRAAEYAEVTREAERFLEHVARERGHREFSYPEVEELEGDLGKLKRWAEQVRTRDYFGAAEVATVEGLLAQCDEALATFLDQASTAALEREEAPM